MSEPFSFTSGWLVCVEEIWEFTSCIRIEEPTRTCFAGHTSSSPIATSRRQRQTSTIDSQDVSPEVRSSSASLIRVWT